MSRALLRATLALAWLYAGCGKSHLADVPGGAARADREPARAPAGASVDVSSSAPHVLGGDGEASTPAHGAAAAGAGALDPQPPGPEVWVGELWSLSNVLCERSGWLASDEQNPQGHSEHVVLMLDGVADSAPPRGRIRFGEGELPSEPDTVPIDPLANDLYTCSDSSLARGGVYSLLEARRSPAQLHFEVAPSEIWQPWCTRMHYRAWTGCTVGAQCCPCDKNGCRPGVGHRIIFDFTIGGDTMDTVIDTGVSTQVRLKRMR